MRMPYLSGDTSNLGQCMVRLVQGHRGTAVCAQVELKSVNKAILQTLLGPAREPCAECRGMCDHC